MRVCDVTSNGERICSNKAFAEIKDIKCGGDPFDVCKKHAKEFLKTTHYKLIKIFKKKG